MESTDAEELKPRTVTAIPNVWARAMFMETALHSKDYPLRAQMVEQWQGMLAAIALAEICDFDLKVRLINLAEEKDRDDFARALYQLLPEPDLAIYWLDDKPKDYNPWQELYVFLWAGAPVGMTSLSTLVCPSEEGSWTNLPWYRDGRLVSPVSHLNPDERELLWLWLSQLSSESYRIVQP